MMNYPGHFGFWQQPGSSSNGGSNSLLASTLSSSAAYDTVSVNNSNGNVMDSGGMRQLFTSAFEPTSAHLQQQMRNSMNHNHKNPSIHGGLDSLIMQQMPPAMGGFHHQQQQQHPSTTDLSNNNNNSGRTTSVINGGGFNNNGMVVNSAGNAFLLSSVSISYIFYEYLKV
jgi:hypothetical protein